MTLYLVGSKHGGNPVRRAMNIATDARDGGADGAGRGLLIIVMASFGLWHGWGVLGEVGNVIGR